MHKSSKDRVATPRLLRALIIVLVVGMSMLSSRSAVMADDFSLGGFGPEGARMREQFWLVPSADASIPMRATLFRPDRQSEGTQPVRAGLATPRLPLVIINHGTDDATRLSLAMPVYYWLSRWFVDRGYAVLLPQRRGHGATGGALAEAIGTCDNPDHYQSGLVAARDLSATIAFMKEQPFVDKEHIIVAGISTGGWASLALAALDPQSVRAVVNFAGGRGGHAYGKRRQVCAEDKLFQAARQYGQTARAPTIWFYAKNDSYFPPRIAEGLAQAWSSGGGLVEANIVADYGSEGHSIADDRAGWDIWGPALDRFLARLDQPAQDGMAALHEVEPPVDDNVPVVPATSVSAAR